MFREEVYGKNIKKYLEKGNSMPKVSIIILNWNGWEDTIECLESLYRITYPNYDVIVADNGSEDKSVQKIREYCEGKINVESKFFKYSSENKPIKIIEYTREGAEAGGGREKEIVDLPSNRKLIIIKNEKNYGFAEGNNIGMRYALKALNSDYVLLLNNDTVVEPNFLSELIHVIKADYTIGIAGPKFYYYNNPQQLEFIKAKIDLWRGRNICVGGGEIDYGQYDDIEETDIVRGACILIKRETLVKIGFLDSSFFSYFEETDLCLRAKRAGYQIIYCPKAKIWHKGSSTAGKVAGFVQYHLARNRFWFMKKHSTRKQYFLFLLYFFGFHLWFITGSLLIYHRDIKSILPFYKGTKDGLLFEPKIRNNYRST